MSTTEDSSITLPAETPAMVPPDQRQDAATANFFPFSADWLRAFFGLQGSEVAENEIKPCSATQLSY
jgi:hypothetical protein